MRATHPKSMARPGETGRLGCRVGGRRGFTLVELLVVITVLTILATFITVAVVQAFNSAKISECEMKIQTLGAALEEYQRKCGSYPVCDETDPIESSKILLEALSNPPKGVRYVFEEENFNCQDIDESGQKCIVDPWLKPIAYMPAKGYSYLPPNKNSFRLVSAGPDGSFTDSDEDNVFNWKFEEAEDSPYHLRQMR